MSRSSILKICKGKKSPQAIKCNVCRKIKLAIAIQFANKKDFNWLISISIIESKLRGMIHARRYGSSFAPMTVMLLTIPNVICVTSEIQLLHHDVYVSLLIQFWNKIVRCLTKWFRFEWHEQRWSPMSTVFLEIEIEACLSRWWTSQFRHWFFLTRPAVSRCSSKRTFLLVTRHGSFGRF